MATMEPGQSDGEESRPSSRPGGEMVEDDSIDASQRDAPGRTKEPTKGDPTKLKRDEFIMDTNNSSIVSKRSVEKMYYGNEPEYFRYFVSKFKRRSPLINRGYWLRMKAIEHTVTRFLAERTAKRKVVVNLGCGYDPLPFLYLGKHPELCGNTTFVDVDYPVLMQNKLGIIDKTEPLRVLLPKLTKTHNETGLIASSDPYVAIGCDLYNLDMLKHVLQDHLRIEDSSVAILFVAEVSLAYMEKEATHKVLEWAAGLSDVRFCLLEQYLPDGPDHPFARTMLAHFEKLRTPLNAIGTMNGMKQRFAEAGWPDVGIDVRSLWELWSDPTFLTPEQRRSLDKVEPFDEWEEFGMFASHYFLLVAERKADQDWSYRPYRASLAGSTSRISLASAYNSGDTSPVPNVPQEQPLQAPELPSSFVPRRFAAVVPATSEISEGEAVGLLGGLGNPERLTDCDTYSHTDDLLPISGPPMRSGIMCHAVTRLGGTSNCIMTGGRGSPDKASAECWIRQDGMWRRSQPLPEGRYRHCAVPMRLPTEPRPAHTVLLFGGKTSDGHVLDEWLLWMFEGGWRRVHVAGDAPPARFGAAMITDAREGTAGVLIGGMTSAGRVLTDFWHWSLESDMTIHCRNITARASAVLRTNANILGRFGAQLVRTNRGILMIGGICGGRMLTSQDEVLNMKTLRTHPVQGKRPMFVGCSITDVDGGLIVLGGGATCFSFGSYWNKPSILTDSPEASLRCGWHLLTTSKPDTVMNMGQTDVATRSVPQQTQQNGHADSDLRLPDTIDIPRRSLAQGIDFERFVGEGRPVIFSEGDIGPCTSMWSNSYLQEAIGYDRKVVVHSSPAQQMDFKNKNFEYVTQDFGAFLNACQSGEQLYLRALSRDAPSDQPTNLADDYPEIAADFELPGELIHVVENLHSSPLRISGPVTMWLHYDVMANVLCQVRGRKRLLLYPPSDVSHLGFTPGASSSSMDVFTPDGPTRQSLVHTHPYEANLEPGEILFIPPMWIHTAAPTEGMSVAVNIFFRSLQTNSYAAGRDVYGNRDLAPYERGRKDIARIVKSFDDLPSDVSGFYLERLGQELLEQARTIRNSSQLHTINDPPVYSITAEKLSQALDHLATQPLPSAQQVFPWLHGLHAENQLQLGFFVARKKALRRTPQCVRGLTVVKAGGDLSHSKVKGAVAPEEILMPIQAGRTRKDADTAEFMEADPKDGFGVRNFHIQTCKMASVSDIVVYRDNKTPKEEAERLAKRIARAQTAWQRKMDGTLSGGRLFNTFLVSDEYTMIETDRPELVALDSQGCITGQVVDFFYSERVEMCSMSAASEIAHNVWLGPTPDPAIELNLGHLHCSSGTSFDVMVEASDMAQIPDGRTFKMLDELLQQKEDAGLADNAIPQLEFPGSGAIMPPTWSQAEVDGLLTTCEWIYKQAHTPSASNKRRDSKFSLGEYVDADGDTPMHSIGDATPDGRRILIHCGDGYTESSLLALAYYMYAECVPVHDAWLQLHREKRRNFFAYGSDVALLRAVEPRILQASPKHSGNLKELCPPAPDWLERMDGSLPSRVMDYMYLGNLGHANNPGLLHELGIGQILSVGEPVGWSTDATAWPAENLLFVDKVQDNGVDPLTEDFPRCLAFIEKGRRNGTKTLVHCRVGVSRSATICIAEVMNELGLSFPRAYCFVRARRLNVIIQPHLRFTYELLKWEESQCLKRGRPLRRELEWANLAREIAAMNKPYSRQ
ncbi:hypothetical protein LTR08_002665 [Meristemomyces frigidus]|nr:hypothetical protein LTR08_002665 [Meristemomyces frigidus]